MEKLSDRIFYDSASAYTWSELNESTFLIRMFSELKRLMADTFLDYKFYILSSHNMHAQPESISDPSPNKVLIFISDERSSIPRHLQTNYLAIFKGYLQCEFPRTNIFPFNLGYVNNVPVYPIKPVEDRRINVFFAGNLNYNRLKLYRSIHPVYQKLSPVIFRTVASINARMNGRMLMRADLSHSLSNSILYFTDGFKRGLSPEEYGRTLADSCIVLCPKGFNSPETFRHFEAMRAGAVVISEPLPDTHFYRDSPIIIVSDWQEGLAKAKSLIANPDVLKRLQLETIHWWKTVCSEEATARYLRDKLLATSYNKIHLLHIRNRRKINNRRRIVIES